MAFKTVGEFSRDEQIPEWKVRRIVDSLPLEIPRMGRYRILSDEVQSLVLEQLNQEVER
jgi:hypothetical protein